MSNCPSYFVVVTNQTNIQESAVTMKTGVLSRLSQWEKGQVVGSSASERMKAKVIFIL